MDARQKRRSSFTSLCPVSMCCGILNSRALPSSYSEQPRAVTTHWIVLEASLANGEYPTHGTGISLKSHGFWEDYYTSMQDTSC